MRDLQIIVKFVILAWIVPGIAGQNEICSFYGLEANCRYRIDAISLSHIRAEIDQCADPIEVTIMITNERPHVDFKYTFNRADTLVSVPRFTVETQLCVRLTKKEDDVINVEADFYVYGQARADFINDDIKLRGLEEHCPILNSAAKIAIGVMGGLAVIAAILIFILVLIRYRRKRKRQANAENQLVENAAEPGTSSPVPSLTNLNEDHVTDQVSGHRSPERSANSESNRTTRTSAYGDRNEAISNGHRNADLSYGHNNTQPSVGSHRNENGLDVRFSEIMRKQNLKISDC